jgi:hypothetical protein
MEPHWVYSHFRTKKDSLDNFYIYNLYQALATRKNIKYGKLRHEKKSRIFKRSI